MRSLPGPTFPLTAEEKEESELQASTLLLLRLQEFFISQQVRSALIPMAEAHQGASSCLLYLLALHSTWKWGFSGKSAGCRWIGAIKQEPSLLGAFRVHCICRDRAGGEQRARAACTHVQR